MSDPLTKSLRELENLDYPGRRKPIGRVTPRPKPDETPVWTQVKPTHYLVDGEKREFFFIGTVAKALGYSVQSIRAWEDQGLMPITPFRSPKTDKMITNKVDKRKRLWTREQIEGILRIAVQHKVITNKKPPTPAFAHDVARFFASLVQQQHQ